MRSKRSVRLTFERPPPTVTTERRAGPRFVRDFNTLNDLIGHALDQLGATHVAGDGAHTRIYFPRGGQYPYEEARVWRKAGYWHAEGPHARVGVSRLPQDAKPIARIYGRRAAESGRMHQTCEIRQAAIRFDDDSGTWGTIEEVFTEDVADDYATVEKYQYMGLEIVCADEQGGDVQIGDRARVDDEGMIKKVVRENDRIVEDYIAYDRHGRPMGPPFEHYGDARGEAEREGGHVEFVPKRRRVRENQKYAPISGGDRAMLVKGCKPCGLDKGITIQIKEVRPLGADYGHSVQVVLMPLNGFKAGKTMSFYARHVNRLSDPIVRMNDGNPSHTIEIRRR
jgi:hypothetical protein